MTDHTTTAPRLWLEPIAGPPVGSFVLEPGQVVTVGRGVSCELCLTDPAVSREHASILSQGNRWFVSDLRSRHGTFVNGVKLGEFEPTGIVYNDLIRIGPWTFRITDGTHQSKGTPTTESLRASADEKVERVSQQDLGLRATHRLNLLIDCAAMINTARDEDSLAKTVLDAAIAGSGYHRAALLRSMGSGDEVEVMCYQTADESAPTDVSYSRSLIDAASTGELARMTTQSAGDYGQSIVELGIHSALCAPIFLGSTVAAYLYLDARSHEHQVQPDAAGFCQAIARLTGLAMSNLKRVQLEKRQLSLDGDLNAAREAQQFIVPADEGRVGRLHFAKRMLPGRLVAGDLFDVFEIDAHRTAVILGDVVGEGAGAAILMASAQAHLHAALLQYAEPAQAVSAVNNYLATRSAPNKFITLWAGIVDTQNNKLHYVDAGHGYWIIRRGGEPVSDAVQPGGIVVGVDPSITYTAAETDMEPGDRLVLFSDGVVEQPAPNGDRFGRERVVEVLRATTSAPEDVEAIIKAIRAFAGQPNLNDDTTVAAVELLPA